MRITNQMILARSLSAVENGLSKSASLERQIASGQRYTALSDAPAVGRTILTIDADLRAGEQYERNINAAQARLAMADDALDAVTRLLTRAREIAIQQGGDTASTESRQAARLEVLELRAAAIQIANTKHNDAYVFGGEYVDRAPLDASGALDPTAPARGATTYEIAASTTAFGAHDAGEMFIDTEVIATLDDLEVALAADDRLAIQNENVRTDTVISTVQRLVAEVGARQNRLDSAQGALIVVEGSRQAQRSVLADVPIAEAVTELAAHQASYQASLLVTSRLLDTSLVNYLR